MLAVRHTSRILTRAHQAAAQLVGFAAILPDFDQKVSPNLFMGSLVVNEQPTPANVIKFDI